MGSRCCCCGSRRYASDDGSGKITYKRFLDVKKTDTLRQTQKHYEEIVAAAKEKNIRVMDEMKARGYATFRDFSKGCPPFKITCWVSEFAELGSGYVLYFHFLTFLGVLLLLLFLLQLPVLAVYGRYNHLEGWQWSNWQAAFRTEDPCECVGFNRGVTSLPGLPGQNDYGTSCGAWDSPRALGLGNCSPGQPCPSKLKRPGQWLCRKWCFAGPHCPTKYNKDQPSLTNVRWHPTAGNDDQHFVKSYSFCSKESADMQPCSSGVLSADVAFSEPGVELDTDDYSIGSQWLTPGNFGPDQADLRWIPPLYLACVCIVCFLVLVMYQRVVVVDRQVDADNLLPNDFAIVAKGLPRTATDDKQILQWFEENSLPGKKVEVVKVVVGWDVEEFRQHRNELAKLGKQLRKIEDKKGDEARELIKKMREFSDNLMSAASGESARLQSSGFVVVSFRHHADMKAIVRRWSGLWAHLLNKDGTGVFGCCAKPLPLFPLGDAPVCRIKVERAPNPGDINWEELSVPFKPRMLRLLVTNGAMFLLIAITFVVTWGMEQAQKASLDKAKNMEGGERYGFEFISLIPAAFVSLMNMILAMAARTLGKLEYHDTFTTEEFSQAMKMTCGMLINTVGVILFQNARPDEWYMRGGLVENLISVLVMNSLIPTFMPVFEFNYWMLFYERWRVTQSTIDKWNEILKDAKPGSKERERVTKAVEAAKEPFKPETMDQPSRFAMALQITLCSIFFMPVMPWVPLLGIVGLFIQYWTDKWMLVRKYRRPEMPTNANLVFFCLRFLKLTAPLALTVSTFLFLMPSFNFEEKSHVVGMFHVSIAVALIFSFGMPLRIWVRCFMCVFGQPAKPDDVLDYYKAQIMWSKEMKYHKDHFLYKKLPDHVNPEILKPGETSTVKISDVKDSYGVAFAAAADASTAGGRVGRRPIKTHQVLRGGQVISMTEKQKEEAGGDATSSAGSQAYGISSAGPPRPAPAELAPPAPPRPAPAAPAPATFGVPAAGEPQGPSSFKGFVPTAPPSEGSAPPRPTWEYRHGDRWHTFGDDCHNHIETQYQKFSNGVGQERVKVHTNLGSKRIELSLDFIRMTQMKADTRAVSKIQRRIV